METQISQLPNAKQILDATVYISYCMLRHGAEISRVEDTARRICLSYGMDEAHVFAVSSTIIITVVHEGETLTQTRRVISVSTNLDRVDRLNALSRTICENHSSYDSIIAQINAIENRPLYPPFLSVAAYALIGGSFAIFFGGTVADGVVAAAAGAVVRLIILLLQFLRAAPFFTTAAASAVTAACAHLAVMIFAGLHAETITIGVLMNLVPGVALTNSMRDFIATDYVSGMSRLTEAFFTATAIALGVAVVLLWN